jgi:DtxR family Mn-dependent transcriptional regulator
MHYTPAEENYIKAIFHLSENDNEVSTKEIADRLQTKPASVSDMLRKLADKLLVNYTPYHGVSLTENGRLAALRIIRKHRLWEVFLVEKLRFNWDEVHEVAEQLEHIVSPLLIERLDEFLGHPRYDPHGDPIPDAHGRIHQGQPTTTLADAPEWSECELVAVCDSGTAFLQYLDKIGLRLGAHISITERIAYDGSMQIVIDRQKSILVSREVSANLLILPL